MTTRSMFEEERRGGDDRREPDRGAQLKERVQVYTVVIALVSLVFTGGYNWRRVDELSATVRRLDETAVKRDVLTEQFVVVRVQLEALKQQLDDLKLELQAQRR